MRVLPVILFSSPLLTGCFLTTGSSSPKSPDPIPLMCKTFVPIHWSDTTPEPTKTEVRQHNAVWLELCGPIMRPAQRSLPP